MNNPKVTIITPSYNQGEFLEDTINSVLNQTYNNIEYIIIDACSTDNTSDILSKYSNKIDRIIVEKDNGQSDAINKGIKLANGELITWINSDDILYQNSISEIVNIFLHNEKVDMVYGNVDIIDENNNFKKNYSGRKIILPNVFRNLDLPIPQQGCTWRKCVNEEIGLLNNKWNFVLDRDYFLRICLNHKIFFIPKTLGAFRHHSNSKSIKLKDSWINEIPEMYNNLINNKNWKYNNTFFKKSVISSAHIHCVYISLNQLQFKTCFKHFFIALKIYPLIIFHPHIYFKFINKLKSLFG